jgi:Domain of unknown function DUF11/RTX calcium-binding nonapeptide repeat (4 copies)
VRRFFVLPAVAAAALALPSTSGAVTSPPPLPCGLQSTHPCQSDFALNLSPPPGTVYVGEAVAVSLTVTNLGPDRASPSIQVTDPGTSLPGDLGPEYAGECISSCTVSLPSLAARASITRAIRVRPQIAGALTIGATVTQSLPRFTDPNVVNNTATTSITAVIGRCTSALGGFSYDERLVGSIGGDLINASRGDDQVDGNAGDDCIEGGFGNDTIDGGPGNDVLKGGPGRDLIVGGPGRDKIEGGAGGDTIDAADGWRDRISCGLGTDALEADPFDRFHGCEHVRIVR